MLVTFKSHASADVIMFGDAAKKLIKIVGKDPLDAQGIITAQQLPDAIARLKAAIEEDRAREAELERQRNPDHEQTEKEAGHAGMAAPVGLAQRAWPLLNMMEASLHEEAPVVWGV
ncbi:DUF1840 domain-containing protein [Thauera sp. WH-2]|jgi:hypothetical protein|uniref:DUF1840 domain-containing protein n=1 Tax=unclassified Thauera TaxID=2609274 RepID=UPI002A48B150|nr:DUF1840 domain-containing protein [Thauera sp.]